MRLRRFRYWQVPLLCLLALLTLAGAPAAAQTATGADLEGVVVDDTNAVIPGVVITVTNVETGAVREAVSDNAGRYRVSALPPGRYKLRANGSGYAPIERDGLVLQIGQVATIELKMQVPGVEEVVVVTEAAPVVETGRTQLGSVVNRVEIENLPINGREFLDFARTVPGVSGQQTSGQGSGLSFNGQRGRSNNVSVDGADSNGQLNGNTRLTLSQEAVREFQVVTNAFAPEFGRAGGGLVNVVSRSGTNAFSGNAFAFFRDESLDGRNFFAPDGPKPQFQRQNYGFTLGGPIVKERTFFFGAVEQMKRDESDVVVISDANLAAINARLAERPIPGSNVRALRSGVVPVTADLLLPSVKVDHLLAQGSTLTVRYLYGKSEDVNAGSITRGGLVDESGSGGEKTIDQSLMVSLTSVFGPRLLSETRFQYAPRELMQSANDGIGPRVTISGVATFGRNVNFPVRLDETGYQAQQTFGLQTGAHYFKFGGDVTHIRALTSFPVSFGGSFTFANLQSFLDGRPSTFVQGFGDPEIRLNDTLVAGFLQDTWKIGRSMTLVYGVRYDYDLQPQSIARDPNNPLHNGLQTGIHRDSNNIQPRVSLAYDPGGEGHSVIRAGYGRFYDKLFLLVARNALLTRQSITLSGQNAINQFAQGAFPQNGQLPPGLTLTQPNITRTAEDIEIPYNDQAHVGFEQQLARNWSFGANYVWVRGRDLIVSDSANLGPPVELTLGNAATLGVANPSFQQLGRQFYGTRNRLDPQFNNINLVSSTGRSQYHGLQTSLQKRWSSGSLLRFGYVLAQAKDDASDFVTGQQPENPYDRAAEFSRSFEDARHRVTVTGVFDLPYRSDANNRSVARSIFGNWSVSTLITYRSGTPDSITVGSDVNGDGNSTTDRPFVDGVLLGRNSTLGPDFATVDARLSKAFALGGRARLHILIEAFNLFDRVNYFSPNNVWGTGFEPAASFGEFTGAGDPRQTQLGVKIEFDE